MHIASIWGEIASIWGKIASIWKILGNVVGLNEKLLILQRVYLRNFTGNIFPCVRERLQSAPTLFNTLKHLIANAWIAKNGLLTINAMAVRERL